MGGSITSERRSMHSREPSWDKPFQFRHNAVTATAAVASGSNSAQHSRNSSWDKKFDDVPFPPQRRTPPQITILPTSAPGTRRNSGDFKPAQVSWAGDKLNTGQSRRWLMKSLSKLSTSLGGNGDDYYMGSDKSPSFDKYNHYPSNDKALHSGYHQTFRKAPIGWTIHNVRRLLNYLLKPKRLIAMFLGLLLMIYMFWTPLVGFYRSNRFLGGGSKYVIILAANQDGGVLKWKGAKEWAVERESVKNKKEYAARHGYTLEIKDMKALKRYAHEWRESWEKVDVLRQAMRKYPHAQWFWYLDIQTFIMEPSISLQSHIFNKLNNVAHRDISYYNPKNITHPLKRAWLDDVATSTNGDGQLGSIYALVPQDCGGFNLGSFFVKRGEFTDRLMDVWWDPVGYEQMHMAWEHKEQNVLEHIYMHQPWARNGIAFLDQRRINSFPPGACKEMEGDKRIFYRAEDRDFLVNMAGCEWGRDCAEEMKQYREISEKLNRRKSWFW